MKACSICQRQYADALKFCLDDGTVLTHAPDLDATLVDPQATLRLNARETDARPVALNHTKSLPWIALAVVSIVVIAVVGVAALFFNNSATNSSNESNSANSSPPSQSSPQISTLSAADEVLRANDAIGRSLVEGDTQSLARLLADDYRYEHDLNNEKLFKEDVLRLIRTGGLRYDYLTTMDPKVEVSSDSTRAVLTARAKAKGKWNQPFDLSYSYRNTYEKRDGRWQLVEGFARFK